MSSAPIRFSLKKKLISLLVCTVIVIIAMAAIFSFRIIDSINQNVYTSRAKQLSATAAEMLDAKKVRQIRDEIMEIYGSTKNRVSSDDWGSDAFHEYLHRYDSVAESESFKDVKEQMRVIQDNNELSAVYLVWLDAESESTIYLADAAHDGNCPPGCFDPVLYEVDREALKNPENGVEPDITNTEEYGWIVAAGSPVFLGGELVAFVGTDIDMNKVMADRTHYVIQSTLLLAVLGICAILISIFLIDRMIVRPINKLSETSKKYWSEEDSGVRYEFSRLHIHTGDEIETLSNSMKQMELNINENISKLMDTTEKLMMTKERAEEMDRAANIDALTKVRNKRAYDTEIQAINEEIRKGNTHVGLVMIDLNYLKITNDLYGHEKGNEAIRTLCKIICDTFHHSPVFRIGGDEFVVVLKDQDLEDLEDLKREFGNKMAEQGDGKAPGEGVSAAAGYAVFDPGMDKTIEDTFMRADSEMYRRKKEMKAERK